MIIKKINQIGGFVKGKIPKETFFIIDENGEKKPQIFLPNKNGLPVPIKKVRIRENIGGAEKLKENTNQYVNPRSNHHVLIYKDIEGDLKEDVVTFWTAVERKKQGLDVFQLPKEGNEIINSLQINDFFLLGLLEEQINWNHPDKTLLNQHLFRVQKFTSGDYYFRNINASTINNLKEKQQINSFGFGKNGWQTHNPIKVKINSIGLIEKV